MRNTLHTALAITGIVASLTVVACMAAVRAERSAGAQHDRGAAPSLVPEESKARAVRPLPEEQAAALRRGRIRREIRAQYRAAFLAGNIGEAEAHLMRLSRQERQPYLSYLLIDQGRFAEVLSELEPSKFEFQPERYGPILAVCYYRLGKTSEGDRWALRAAVDCGVAATPNSADGTVLGDEGPNKPVLDSARKREAAAWHALGFQNMLGASHDAEHLRAVNYSEQAARMFPDEPAFTFTYAVCLERAGYFREAVDWYRRCRQHARGMLIEELGSIFIPEAEHRAEHPPIPDKGRRP
jgi:tetratricopeptide (TPR) repeat protein